jgi:SpoVK/Ycf46/Vps4 family AAA+-type ATPase
MIYFHQIILCLFFISNSLFPINLENKGNTSTVQEKKSTSEDSIKIDPLRAPPIPDDIRKELLQQMPKQSTQEEFDEEDIEEMEMVLDAAPLKAQLIPKYLEDPKSFSGMKSFRSAYFVGNPGTGKTIAAKAIAYKMSQKGWNYKFISSTELVEGYRNQTCVHLREELKYFIASGKPTLIIIDEVNRLLENADSKHHDTDMSATTLWSFLDEQLKNPNFFLIGTMNSSEKLAEPFKNRINFNLIPFISKANPELRIKHLRKKLTNENCCLHKEVTDAFLKDELKRIDSCYGRGLIHVAMHILMLHKINTNEKISIITKESIRNGINEYLVNEEILKANKKTETDEERQERHHRDIMLMQSIQTLPAALSLLDRIFPS